MSSVRRDTTSEQAFFDSLDSYFLALDHIDRKLSELANIVAVGVALMASTMVWYFSAAGPQLLLSVVAVILLFVVGAGGFGLAAFAFDKWVATSTTEVLRLSLAPRTPKKEKEA